MSTAKTIALKDGLWVIKPDGKPRLLASKCRSCGEVSFPKTVVCPNCQSGQVDVIEAGPRGKVYSATVVMQQPPVWYKGAVPYALGYVELPEGFRVETLFTGCDPEEVQMDMEVELVVEELFEDEEGNHVLTYKFKPMEQ